VGDLGNGLEVGDVVAGVANGLEVDGLGVVVDEGGNVLGLVAVGELGLDAEAGQHDLELVVGATVQVGGGDDVVTGVGESSEGHEESSLAGGGGNSGNTTLESSNTLLEDIDGRAVRGFAVSMLILMGISEGEKRGNSLHDAGVDVAKLLEAEEAGTVGGVVEDIAGGGVDGDSTRLGDGVNLLAIVL